MRILIASATSMEIAPVVAAFGGARPDPLCRGIRHAGHEIDVLVTGVGMVAMAAWCARVLAEARYDLALNLGVCGSFDRAFEPGTVVHVVSDRIAELGAEDGDAFLTIEELELPGRYDFENAVPPANETLRALPAVTAITVNTVHGNPRSIAAAVRRFKPQVESMEGAAFMCACLMHGIPFAQVRAVSNMVETRNREAWRMSEAIASLGKTALRILEHA
jgi:futalosine hydrolase